MGFWGVCSGSLPPGYCFPTQCGVIFNFLWFWVSVHGACPDFCCESRKRGTVPFGRV